MYGQFVRHMEKEQHRDRIGKEDTWAWMKKSDLKIRTEALIWAAQEQALCTKYVKFNIDHTANFPLCRSCGATEETLTQIVDVYRSTSGGTRMLHALYIGNCVGSLGWRDLRNGTSISLRRCWKMQR